MCAPSAGLGRVCASPSFLTSNRGRRLNANGLLSSAVWLVFVFVLGGCCLSVCGVHLSARLAAFICLPGRVLLFRPVLSPTHPPFLGLFFNSVRCLHSFEGRHDNSDCLSCASVCLSVCLSRFLCICLTFCQSVCPSLSLSANHPVCLLCCLHPSKSL